MPTQKRISPTDEFADMQKIDAENSPAVMARLGEKLIADEAVSASDIARVADDLSMESAPVNCPRLKGGLE